MVPKGSTTPEGAANFPPLASARQASSAQAAALAPEVLALASASFSSLGFFACTMYKQTESVLLASHKCSGGGTLFCCGTCCSASSVQTTMHIEKRQHATWCLRQLNIQLAVCRRLR